MVKWKSTTSQIPNPPTMIKRLTTASPSNFAATSWMRFRRDDSEAARLLKQPRPKGQKLTIVQGARSLEEAEVRVLQCGSYRKRRRSRLFIGMMEVRFDLLSLVSPCNYITAAWRASSLEMLDIIVHGRANWTHLSSSLELKTNFLVFKCCLPSTILRGPGAQLVNARPPRAVPSRLPVSPSPRFHSSAAQRANQRERVEKAAIDIFLFLSIETPQTRA